MTAVHDAYVASAADGSTDIWEHLPTLYEAARNAQTVIEIGVGSCRSTLALLAGVEESGGQLWSAEIDPTPIPEWLLDHPQWTLAVGDSLAVVYDAPIDVDVLFIDSNHEFQHTYSELTAYVPRVRPGGVVLLHDTGSHPEVADALNLYGLPWTNNPSCNGLGRIDIP